MPLTDPEPLQGPSLVPISYLVPGTVTGPETVTQTINLLGATSTDLISVYLLDATDNTEIIGVEPPVPTWNNGEATIEFYLDWAFVTAFGSNQGAVNVVYTSNGAIGGFIVNFDFPP